MDARSQISDQQPQIFVGRGRELRQLELAFEAATRHQGALIMLVGEPGIGKTAVCEQLARSVRGRGGIALVGHCYEEGSFRVPYQPFVETLDAYLQECPPDELKTDLGSEAADLARIIPSLAERLDVTPRPPGDHEEDRWRLLHAVTRLLHGAATRHPLLLILEDLHDADRGTLDLLVYLARYLQGASIELVGTYRDVEVDRAHPLSAALSQLHRASNFTRIHLRGLPTNEVLRLLRETSHYTIPQPFAEFVHRQTDGNPLYVHQVLRFVVEEGLVEPRNGALRRVGEERLAGRIPEGLRDVVGKRVSMLTEQTKRTLSVASVIGREFDVDVLGKVVGYREEKLEGALEEASAAAIIEEHSVLGTTITYRFSHAFIRQTLYEEIVAPRRIRLHQQVAHAMEEVHRKQLHEHAAELAEHFAWSSDIAGLAKAVQYAETAAHQANDVFAYGEAARQLERALQVQESVDPTDVGKRCDLLLRLGEALGPLGDHERVIGQIAPEAVALAESIEDHRRAFRACHLAVQYLEVQDGPMSSMRPDYVEWAHRAVRHAQAGSVEQVYAELAQAHAAAGQGQDEAAWALKTRAFELARQQDDRDALFFAASQLLLPGTTQHFSEQLQLAQKCTRWPRARVSARSLALLLFYAGGLELSRGDRPRAEELWTEVEALAERTHVVSARLYAQHCAAILSIIDGHFDVAFAQLEQFVHFAEESGACIRGRMFMLMVSLWPSLMTGRAEEWLAALHDYTRLPGASAAEALFAPMAALCHAHLGRLDTARALVGWQLDEKGARSDPEYRQLIVLLSLLETAILLRHAPSAAALARDLESIAALAAGDRAYTSVARLLGAAAASAGDRAKARAYYDQALASCSRINFRPEQALVHLHLAELLIDDAHSEALAHLNAAVHELQEMHMQPALERAQHLLNVQNARPSRLGQHRGSGDDITNRERHVLALMAAGRSNREIAGQLVISQATVEVHIKHILNKLGLRSRTQAAMWFADQRSKSERHDC